LKRWTAKSSRKNEKLNYKIDDDDVLVFVFVFFGFLRKIAFDKQHYHKLLLIKKTVILLDAAR
jgi:hypothetical protein